MLHVIYTIYLFKKTKNSIELSKVNDVGVPLFIIHVSNQGMCYFHILCVLFMSKMKNLLSTYINARYNT